MSETCSGCPCKDECIEVGECLAAMCAMGHQTTEEAMKDRGQVDHHLPDDEDEPTPSETPRTDREEYTVGRNDFGYKVVNPALCRIMEKELREVRRLYDELLMEVSNKFPEETRHETARRYIREREQNRRRVLKFTPVGVCVNCLNGGHSICDRETCECRKRNHDDSRWWAEEGPSSGAKQG